MEEVGSGQIWIWFEYRANEIAVVNNKACGRRTSGMSQGTQKVRVSIYSDGEGGTRPSVGEGAPHLRLMALNWS